MNELQMQKLVIDSVIEGGGRAMKLQNEFVRGVSDLLVKMPGGVPFFLEAKRTDLGKRTLGLLHHEFKWDVSQLQKNFLRDWHKAGMKCGVVSFVQLTGGDIRSLRMAIYPYLDCVEQGWTGSLADHVELGDHVQRSITIRTLLNAFKQVP